jgi:hypothetical protein
VNGSFGVSRRHGCEIVLLTRIKFGCRGDIFLSFGSIFLHFGAPSHCSKSGFMLCCRCEKRIDGWDEKARDDEDDS